MKKGKIKGKDEKYIKICTKLSSYDNYIFNSFSINIPVPK